MVEFLWIVGIGTGLIALWSYIQMLKFRAEMAQNEAQYWKSKYKQKMNYYI